MAMFYNYIMAVGRHDGVVACWLNWSFVLGTKLEGFKVYKVAEPDLIQLSMERQNGVVNHNDEFVFCLKSGRTNPKVLRFRGFVYVQIHNDRLFASFVSPGST